jgi:tripartite-type tricarboxylate transporter receptor subunit TctC
MALMIRFALALALMAATAGAASAQPATPEAKWPDRPLRFIVPLPAGAAADIVARLIGQRLSTKLGQPVIVENRAGASGSIGTDAVAKAAPDGYTLGLATSSTHITAPVLNPKLPYDPVKDFAPVAIVGISPYVLVVNPNLPANNVAELIALAKAKPKTLSYSSVGNASQAHLSGELFSNLAGVTLNHIPYKSSTHAVIDLTEGRIDMQFGILGTSLALIREGKLRALATTTEQRTEDTPNVPTMAEAGLPGFEASLIFAVMLPAATPAPIVTLLNREITEIMAAPEVKRALAAQAIYATSSTPAELGARIRKEIDLWSGLAKRAGIRAE